MVIKIASSRNSEMLPTPLSLSLSISVFLDVWLCLQGSAHSLAASVGHLISSCTETGEQVRDDIALMHACMDIHVYIYI